MSACLFHDDSAICTECPSAPRLDGLGFPHWRDAAGRTPLRVCPSCQEPKRLEEWDWNLEPLEGRCRACLDRVCPLDGRCCGHECDVQCALVTRRAQPQPKEDRPS